MSDIDRYEERIAWFIEHNKLYPVRYNGMYLDFLRFHKRMNRKAFLKSSSPKPSRKPQVIRYRNG